MNWSRNLSYLRTTEVVTPADTHDLITLANFKIDAGITVDTDDEYLARAISRASSAVETYCIRTLPSEEVCDTFTQMCHATSLPLSHYPVTAIGTVTLDGAALTEGVDFRVDRGEGWISSLHCHWAGLELAVTYTGGYVAIPLDLQGATGEIVKALQFNRSRDPSLKSENILSGLYAYTLFDGGASGAGTAQQVSAILDRYKRRDL